MRLSRLSYRIPTRHESAAPVSNRLDPLWILGLVLLTRLPDLFSNYRDWDEASMMSEAWAMTRGELLYRDIAQIHPVLNFAVFVPFFAWLKPAVAPHAIKAFNAALVCGGAFMVRRLVARWTADRDCALAAALLFAWLLGRDWAVSSYGEFYTLFPVLLSALLLQAKQPRWAAVGALWGVAFFFKQVAVFDAAALTAGFLLLRRRPAAEAARAALRIAAGGAVVTAVVAAYFALKGTVPEAFEAMFTRALAYRSLPGLPLATRAGLFAKLMIGPCLREFAPCWLLAAAALAAARYRGASMPVALSEPLRICALWLCVAFFGVWSVGKIHLHYALVLVPSACLLAGLSLHAAPPRARRVLSRALAAVLLLLGALTCAPRLRDLAKEGWIDQRVRGSLALAAKIRERTRPDERIFLYGINNLDVFYLSERLPSNGIYMYLSMEKAFLHKPELVELQRRQMREAPPSLMVVNNTPTYAASLETREFFSALLRDRYERVDTLGVADLYRLKAR